MPSPALSRRDFLKRTSLASAAAVTFPYVSRAQGGASPNNKLNIAIVGCGGRGRAHVTAYAATENIVAALDGQKVFLAQHRAAMEADAERAREAVRQVYSALGDLANTIVRRVN